MNSNFTFSIIIPTYNRAHLIERTLNTLLSQNYIDYELIIIDDGSTDNTFSIVDNYLSSNVKYFKTSNQERGASRNFGASMASGKYVNFFDSDDLAFSNYLSIANCLITKNINLEWFFVNYEIMSDSGNLIRAGFNFTDSTLNTKLSDGNFLSCSSVFIRRDIFLTHKFKEDRELAASEDYELWLRLAARYPLYFSSDVGCQLIDHSERSVRNVNAYSLIARINLLIKFIYSDPIVLIYFKNHINIIVMGLYSYIALHLSELSRFKFIGLIYLIKASYLSPKLFLSRQFLAICRNFIFKWH